MYVNIFLASKGSFPSSVSGRSITKWAYSALSALVPGALLTLNSSSYLNKLFLPRFSNINIIEFFLWQDPFTLINDCLPSSVMTQKLQYIMS